MQAIAAATSDVEARAIAIASFAHGLQFRTSANGTREPYIVHPMRVREIVSFVPGNTVSQRCAAVLHDVVEDGKFTGVLHNDIERWFPGEIAQMVHWLTDVSTPADGNRAARKAKDREHSAQAPGDVQTVKLSDVASNSADVLLSDRSFALTYLPEKHEQARVLVLGDAQLRQSTLEVIENGMTELGIPFESALDRNRVVRPR
jgi:(p)ppGpp synthase/HD superfamily hydrolase